MPLDGRRRSDSIDISHAIQLDRLNTPPWSPSPVHTPSTGYAPIQEDHRSESDNESLKPEEEHTLHHWERPKPRIWKTLLVQLFAFLWLVPIVALLILNIKRHIIGASAWCPGGHCYPAVYAQRSYDDQLKATELPAKYAKESHNLVGALQFVAKALEVWFIMIASWLVYLITTKLAARSAGLPIGYFTRTSEFDKIPNLFDPLLWTTLRRPPVSRSKTRRARRRIWLFVAFTIILCVVCNLMGPAVAVLVIPTLQWIDTQRHVTSAFVSVNSGRPPSSDGFAFTDASSINSGECKVADFTAQNFSCASWWAASLDSWVEGYGAAQNSERTVSIQDAVSFTYNGTSAVMGDPEDDASHATFEAVTWSPSRQLLNSISQDLRYAAAVSGGDYDGYDSDDMAIVEAYREYNNSVQTIIQRNGPVLGALANVWLGFNDKQLQVIELDGGRAIKCYKGYDAGNMPWCWSSCGWDGFSPVSGTYTRCIPIGAGWNDGYQATNFTIPRQWIDEDSYRPEVKVTVHASSKAAFISDLDPSPALPRGCLLGEPFASCDWDLLWESSTDLNITHRSEPVTTIEMVWETTGISKDPGTSNISIVTDFVTFQAFANYSLDPSVQQNPLFTVDWVLDFQGNVTLNDATTLRLDPAWTLATWTTSAGGNVSDRTGVGLEVRNTFKHILESYNQNMSTPEIISEHEYRLNKVTILPIIQTLSLVDFNTTTASASDAKHDPSHPLLYRYGKINVYAYGLSSRTSWVGVVITSIGCIIVMAEVALGLQDRRRFRSQLQLLVAALEHTYSNEFPRSMHHDEKNIARVSFTLRNDTQGAGKSKFEKSKSP